MKITQKVNLDLAQASICPVIAVKQWDTARCIEAALYLNGVAWEIPDGATVAVRYAKPDRTSGIFDRLPDGAPACTFARNVCNIAIPPAMLTCAGVVRADLVILSGMDVVATFDFTIRVASAPATGTEASQDYYNYHVAYVAIVELLIPAVSWMQEPDGTGVTIDVEVPEAREDLYPSVAIHTADLDAAKAAGLKASAQTLTGKLRLWAMQSPTADLHVTVALMSRSANTGNATGTGSDYTLPVATPTELGGVMIGAGVDVEPDGRISVDALGILEDVVASEGDTTAMLDEVFGSAEASE